MPFGMLTWVGPRNHVLDGSPNAPGEGQFWEEKWRPLSSVGHSMVGCAKTYENVPSRNISTEHTWSQQLRGVVR